MLARTVPVVVARDRLGGVDWRSQGASVILMDDGFQNPAIAKDASLIVIDGNRASATARAPAVPCAPAAAASRTDAVVSATAALRGGGCRIAAQGRPVLSHISRPTIIGGVAARQTRIGFRRDRRSPTVFRRYAPAGSRCRERAFADHHPLSTSEIETFDCGCKTRCAELVTTEKDLARLRTAEGRHAGKDIVRSRGLSSRTRKIAEVLERSTFQGRGKSFGLEFLHSGEGTSTFQRRGKMPRMHR